MATRKDELEGKVLELPAEDRADLARRLIESLEEPAVGDFEAEWIEEAERRYAAYREGVSAGRPGQEVFREAPKPDSNEGLRVPPGGGGGNE